MNVRYVLVLLLIASVLARATPAPAADINLQLLNVLPKDLPLHYYRLKRDVPQTMKAAAKSEAMPLAQLMKGGWVKQDDVTYVYTVDSDTTLLSTYLTDIGGYGPTVEAEIVQSNSLAHAHVLYAAFLAAVTALKVRGGGTVEKQEPPLGNERVVISVVTKKEDYLAALWRNGVYTASITFDYIPSLAKGLNPALLTAVANKVDARIAHAGS